MAAPEIRQQILQQLCRSASPAEQVRLREGIRDEGDYHSLIATAYFANPFFRLLDDERDFLAGGLDPAPLRELLKARDAASRSAAPKVSVFCMPKSGSSFVQSAIQHALQLPLVSLISVGTARMSSYYGMNSREQEIDEMALAKAILLHGGGFVAQVHTRYSMYLARQLNYFRITPLVTVRNILDCIVSFDEMMREWRAAAGATPWINDAQFALPVDYAELDEARRHHILSRSFGVWLIAFYLSWMRGLRQQMISPLMLRYEEHVLDPDRFVEAVAGSLGMTADQTRRLSDYARSPDRAKARLNVGKAGRGRQRVSEEVRAFLLDYARQFSGEIGEDEIAYLIG